VGMTEQQGGNDRTKMERTTVILRVSSWLYAFYSIFLDDILPKIRLNEINFWRKEL